jgi:hypothetical protein
VSKRYDKEKAKANEELKKGILKYKRDTKRKIEKQS